LKLFHEIRFSIKIAIKSRSGKSWPHEKLPSELFKKKPKNAKVRAKNFNNYLLLSKMSKKSVSQIGVHGLFTTFMHVHAFRK